MSQVSRRQLLRTLGAGSLLVSLPILAQQEKRVRRIGFLSGSNAPIMADNLAAFRLGMAELGWTDRRDYVINERYANGAPQTMESLAAELVAAQPDLLLASGNEVVRKLYQRTKTIPIVFAIAQDPVESGLAASLQRPGGNATGLTNMGRELSAKQLQLLKEAFPRVAQVVLLFEPDNVGSASQVKVIEDAAPRLKMRVTPMEIRRAADIEPAFKRGTTLGAQAYVVTQSGLLVAQRQSIENLVLRSKLPAIYPNPSFVESGGLMSYGSSGIDNFRRAAAYVDKILKGAKPGDLPIEQPVKFELLINLKTAKAMGLTIPQSILLRADRVIQ